MKGIEQHLDAFQAVADANDGTRASGTPGYAASRDYVVKKLRAAGYKPQVQSFDFPFFSEDGAAQLARVSPSAKTYAEPADFATMTYSGSGDVTAITIAPSAVDPDDLETLQDLVVAALHDAKRAADELAASTMGPLAGGLGGGAGGGLGLPGF